jgi:hypothetical protein
MQNLSNEQKATMYNQLLFKYQRLQEQVRQIKAENINVSEKDQRRIDLIEREMKMIYNQTQRLY